MPAESREAVISIDIPGRVRLESFAADERLSSLFSIGVQVWCDDMVDFLPHLGSSVTIKVSREGSLLRYYSGLLLSASYVEEEGTGHRFHLVLTPWLQALGRNLDYAIFQQKSALEIVKAVFDRRNCDDVDYSKIVGSFDKREYCVQYRESDLAFVSRLMEEEGIYYYFRHEAGRHVMVLCNARASHEESSYASLPFVPATGASHPSSDRVWQWTERVANPSQGQVALRNWDFKQADAPLNGAYADGERIPGETVEVFDFPAAFLASDLGETRGQMILESARRERRHFVGEGDAMALACGDLLKISGHTVERFNQEYLVIGLNYGVATQQYRSGRGGGSSSHVIIHAVPADTPWRAPMQTPRPVARGPETAIVTGPAGETIYTDDYGRVKVRFHWDRGDTKPENSTCFIRVSHNAAGSTFGNVILPRIGQEVIVDFLSGDPDRPIITGRVYNNTRVQAYGLPEKKTLSWWRSETIGEKGAYDGAEDIIEGGVGYNQIAMEDKGGSENLYFYAQRVQTTIVGLDDKYRVGRDQHLRIGRDRATEVKQNDKITIETGDETHTVQQGKRVTTVQQDDNLTVKMGDVATKVEMGNMATDVKMGDYSLKTDLGSVTVEAMQKIELKVGQSSIVIDQMGVTIKGMLIKVEANVMLEAKGLMTDIKGDVMTTLKGVIVMIN